MLTLTFLAAIFLSGVAAYYSIIGLTLIFTGSFYAILTMGVALEFSKLVATSWLYRNWQSTAFLMKTYMLGAILILMLITSMGIFGFLSRSHLENSALSSNTVDNRIALLDSRIESRETYLSRIQQQIDSIDESFNRYVELGSISRGITERNNFKQERDALEAERKSIDDELLSLREERALALNEKNIAEVEIGPLKYIAELIYADDAEKHFDSAVRWVIILIVSVFDPLAVVLLLAANKTLLDRNNEKIKVRNIQKNETQRSFNNLEKAKRQGVFFSGEKKVDEEQKTEYNIESREEAEKIEQEAAEAQVIGEFEIPDGIIKYAKDGERVTEIVTNQNSVGEDLSFLSQDPERRRYQLSLRKFVNKIKREM